MSGTVGENGSFETLLPRLGDYLLKEGLISPENLNTALVSQKVKQDQGQPVLLGKVLIELGFIDPNVLDQAITKQIFDLHAALKKSNLQLEERVIDRTKDLEHRLLQIRTAAEITQIALAADDLHRLLKEVVRLIVERFGYYSASIFLVDEGRENVILAEAAGPFSESVKESGQVIQIGSRSMVGWVAENNQTRISSDVRQEFFYKIDDLLTETLSEASIPISPLSLTAKNKQLYQSPISASETSPPGSQVLGVLDIQQNKPDAFDPDAISVLQTIANHIASVIENIILLDLADKRLKETTMLFNASRHLAKANNKGETEAVIKRILKETDYPMALLTNRGNEFRLEALFNIDKLGVEITNMDRKSITDDPEFKVGISVSQIESIFLTDEDYILVDLHQPVTYPQPIIQLLTLLGFDSGVLIPIRLDERVEMVLVLGSKDIQSSLAVKNNKFVDHFQISEEGNLAVPYIQANLSLSQLISNTLDRVTEFGSVERRIGALQALNSISQLVSEHKDLNDLYHKIHKEISNLMGDIDFIIATYDKNTDTIQISYMVEVDPETGLENSISIVPFPLGQGLTSIIINSCQPLMINFDTENRALQLGAIILGEPAKSWLGVPLLISGEPIGAIIVQDRFSEGRFKADDQRLLVTMASQVAISIHNARLLESTTRQAERERALLEITNKIRNSSDMQSIMSTTAGELRKILKVHRARLEIDVDAALSSTRGVNSTKNDLKAVD